MSGWLVVILEYIRLWYQHTSRVPAGLLCFYPVIPDLYRLPLEDHTTSPKIDAARLGTIGLFTRCARAVDFCLHWYTSGSEYTLRLVLLTFDL